MAFGLLLTVIFTLLLNVSKCLNPTVYWYTNTNLDNNKRIVAQAPSVFNGFYFCCGKYEFKGDGTFIFYNSSNLIDNINYFRKSMDVIYIHGGIESEDIFNVPLNTLKTQFKKAAQIAKDINIDGFLVDFEAHSDDESLAKKYSKFLSEFESELNTENVEIGMCDGGWGIIKYFNDYVNSNLNIYTSMEPTYNGSKYPEPIKDFIKNETKIYKKNTIRSGIGSMLTKYPPSHTWYFDWTKTKLNDFLNYLKNTVSIPSVDIYRADLDNNGYDTEPWFYQCLEDFVKE